MTRRIFTDVERPVDLSVFCPCLSVDELPAHVRRRRHSVDLDHVVFPLDAVPRCVLPLVAMVVRRCRVIGCRAGELGRQQLHAALGATAGLGDGLFWWSLALSLVIAFVLTVPVNRWLIARGRGHAVRHELHAH